MVIKIPGCSTLTGKPETIINLLKEARYLNSPADGDDYIETLRADIWRCFGVELQVTGETYAERAASLLREMGRKQLIEIKEDKK